MNNLLAASCCALLLTATPTFAASIYRCVDEAGQLTYTRQGCPANQSGQLQEALNPTPGSGKAVPMAKPKPRRKIGHSEADRQLTVVGEQDDGCGNRVTGSARRNAMISQQVLPGMTRADIDSTLGKPDTVTGRNGQVQYRYSSDKSQTRTVSFDEHGCVRGKR
jgi:hypothetical protein